MKHLKKLFLCTISFVLPYTVFGDVKPASVFTDHMVLQRNKAVPVWGEAAPGEKVIVKFAGQTRRAKADNNGSWRVQLKPLAMNKTPQSMEFSGTNTVTLSDILVGDVWICSGQSNMKFGLKGTTESEQIIANSQHSNLRLLSIPLRVQTEPASSFKAAWAPSSPKTTPNFTAVGYLFGQRIHKETDIPIGLIMCAQGSTSVECWVSNQTLQSSQFSPTVKLWKEVEANWGDSSVREKHLHKSLKGDTSAIPSNARTYPGGCYNGMLAPLFPFAFKGVVWYQGEANMDRGHQYRSLFPAMVAEWRKRFEQDDFKFYQVQLPDLRKSQATPGDSAIAELREAQTLSAQNDLFIEVAVIIDTNQDGNVHPKNKQLPGERLAQIALAQDYGRDIEYSGPTFLQLKTEGQSIRLSFNHIGGGLLSAKRVGDADLNTKATNAPLNNFALAGEDRIFHWAQATIEGDQVILRCDAVGKPVAVRYAWADNPADCNFYNQAGLPATPFRTDDWPCISEGKLAGKVLVIR